jgi:signal transduction histidine kinase
MFSRIYKKHSLEYTLQWALGLLITLTLAALVLLAGWIGREATFTFIASRLAHDAEAIIAGFDPTSKTLTRTLPAIYTQPFSGHYYTIHFQDAQSLRSRSLWDTDLNLEQLPTGSQSGKLIDGPIEQRLYLWSAAYEKQGVAFTIAVAEDIAPLLNAIRQFVWYGLLLAILAALALLLTQKRILRRAFARLDSVRDDIRRIKQGSGGELRSDVPAEVEPLVSEFNQLLSTWRGHIERSRNASGNLAHALKSPLHLLYQIGIEKNDQAINEQAERMQQIIERELNRARIAGNVSAGKRFHPDEDMQDLIDTIKILFRDKNLDIELHVQTPEHLPLEQDDMHELIGNLLDNAAKWARNKIVITLEADQGLSLVIQDDGPGIDPALTGDLLRRGRRLDEQTPGHGLGLAIVQDIVEQYKGRIEFTRSAILGGVCITVQLPFQGDY